MSEVYCPSCQNGIHGSMEMEQISLSTWRCPRCLRQREINRHLFCADEIRDLSPAETSKNESCRGKGKILGALAVGAIAIAGIALLSSESTEEGE